MRPVVEERRLLSPPLARRLEKASRLREVLFLIINPNLQLTYYFLHSFCYYSPTRLRQYRIDCKLERLLLHSYLVYYLLYLNLSITIMSGSLTPTSDSDSRTKLTRTVAIIKNHALKHRMTIERRIEEASFEVYQPLL